MEAQQQDDEDDQQGETHREDKVIPDGAGVGNAAQRGAMHEDTHLGMLRLESLPLPVQKVVETLRRSGVERGETRVQEGQGHGLVRAEEMAVLDGETARGTAVLRHQHLQESERVHGDELSDLPGLIGLQQRQVLLHRGLHGLRFQRLGKRGIKGCVDEDGKMLEPVVHRAQHGAHVQVVQDAADVPAGRVLLEQGFAVFVQAGAQGGGVLRVPRIGGSDLDEDFVLQADIAESQLIVGAGTGEELDDVLLIAQLKSEEQEKDETACQQQIQRAFVTPEKVI